MLPPAAAAAGEGGRASACRGHSSAPGDGAPARLSALGAALGQPPVGARGPSERDKAATASGSLPAAPVRWDAVLPPDSTWGERWVAWGHRECPRPPAQPVKPQPRPGRARHLRAADTGWGGPALEPKVLRGGRAVGVCACRDGVWVVPRELGAHPAAGLCEPRAAPRAPVLGRGCPWGAPGAFAVA